MITEEQRHRHSWLAWDGEKIRAADLDWGNISNLNYMAFDIWGQSWATADGTYRDVVYPWIKGDVLTDYTKTVLSWLWTSTVKYTQNNYFDDGIFDGTDITVKPWRIVVITSSVFYWTWTLRLSLTWWASRFLNGSSFDLSSTNPSVSFINASVTEMKIRFKYADAWLNKPIFGAFIQIR